MLSAASGHNDCDEDDDDDNGNDVEKHADTKAQNCFHDSSELLARAANSEGSDEAGQGSLKPEP